MQNKSEGMSMSKKKTIREQILERWETNPPDAKERAELLEEYIRKIEVENARLKRKVAKLTEKQKRIVEALNAAVDAAR